MRMKEQIRAWLRRVIPYEKIPKAVVALHFGIQRVHHGYEVYLSGHADYDDADDWWLLDACYAPRENYVSLGEESLHLHRPHLLRQYKEAILTEWDASPFTFPDSITAVTIGYLDGRPERLR